MEPIQVLSFALAAAPLVISPGPIRVLIAKLAAINP